MAAVDIQQYDILVKGEKVGVAYDSLPFVFSSEPQCATYLRQLKTKYDFNSEELSFLERCLSVLETRPGIDVVFEPKDILLFGQLAQKYPVDSVEIIACSHLFMECIDFDGDFYEDFFKRGRE